MRIFSLGPGNDEFSKRDGVYGVAEALSLMTSTAHTWRYTDFRLGDIHDFRVRMTASSGRAVILIELSSRRHGYM